MEAASPWLLIGWTKHYTITTTLRGTEQSMNIVISQGVPRRSVTLKNRTNKGSSENDSQATRDKQLINWYQQKC